MYCAGTVKLLEEDGERLRRRFDLLDLDLDRERDLERLDELRADFAWCV